MADIGKIQQVEIVDEMQKSYLDYAMSVIVARALPDVRDGLKPVHRRIIFAMQKLGLTHAAHYSKSAKVVGEVLGKFHPHGDAPVYEALVRMAQGFSMRNPLIDGQGNFGSVDGDAAAAMRYCVTGETLVVTEKGLIPIKNIPYNNPSDSISISILSKNRIVNNASKWFDSGNHKTIKITTKQGFNLKGSLNHPVLTWVKNSITEEPIFTWKLLSQLKIGDVTVIDRTPDILWPKKNLPLHTYIPSPQNTRRQIKKLPKTLSADLAFVLGALIAEGTIGENKIEFCNSDYTFIKEFQKRWQKTFPDTRIHKFDRKPSSYGKLPYQRLEIHSRYVIEFLRNLGLEPIKSKAKRIPHTILKSPKIIVSKFLKGYFEGDGSISYSRKMNELSCISISENLLAELQILLLRFGLTATKRFDKYRNTHKLYIRGLKNYQLFNENIGFASQKKTEKLKEILKHTHKDQSLLDFVPYLREYVLSYLDKNLNYTKVREFAYKHNFDRYSNLNLNQSRVSTAVIPTLREDIQRLFEDLISNNYLFDPVVKIEPGGVETVYSLKVDSNCHSFVANGFINHNTEARLASIADTLLYDLDKNTVDWVDNFDGTLKEPIFLPSVLPNLLTNGTSGIAVGMATNIPPHNLNEIVDAIIHLIDNPQAQVEDLMQFVKGPDFPTGAQIYDISEITAAYATGRGKIMMRAKAEIEEGQGGKFQIVVWEIPYQVNKATLVTRIAELVKDKKLDGISDLRDESDRKGLRVVIELKRDARPQSVLNNLYKHTALQQSFPVNMVALINGVPQTLTLKMILDEFIKHRQQVITRRSQFELDEAKKREHVLEGLKIAVDNIDAVIETIKKSKDAGDAKVNLMQKFTLTEIQALAILDMQLKKLAALERLKIEEELKITRELIAYLEDLLTRPEKILKVAKDELIKLKEKFGDERRTKVYKQKIGEFREEDLIPNEPTIVTITQGGYVKRQDIGSFRTQRRGGKGITGITTKEEDVVSQLFAAHTHDNLLFFTNRGRVFQLKVHELPDSSRVAKGVAIVNLLELAQEEKILSILPVKKQVNKTEGKNSFVLMATKKGTVKKTAILAYEAIRRSGIIAIKLTPGDQLRWAKLTDGNDLVFLVSQKGLSIKFDERDVRPMARDTMGVRGIKIKEGDELIGMDVINETDDKADLLVVTVKGIGKKTPISAWPKQLRGGVGVKVANLTEKTGDVVCAQILTKEDEGLILTSQKGQVIRTTLRSIPRLTRDTQGVIVMRLSQGDKVAAATVIAKRKEDEVPENIAELEKEAKQAQSPKTEVKPKAVEQISKPKPKAKPIAKKLVVRKLKRK